MNIQLSVYTDLKYMEKHIRKYVGDKSGDEVRDFKKTVRGHYGVFEHEGWPYYTLYLDMEAPVSTLFHECLHVATDMWNEMGANLVVPDNDEVLAYTQQAIAHQIDDVLHLGIRSPMSERKHDSKNS